jgi:hypothetical protein
MEMSFPGAAQLTKRKTIRTPPNPNDKSTIFSIFPREIVEVKYTIEPGKFVIPAGTIKSPGRLEVGPSSWWAEIDHSQPLLEVPVGSIAIAESVVKDYCSSILGYANGLRSPGIFYVPGSVTVAQMRTAFTAIFDDVVAQQKAWFVALVDIADALWARSNGNPMVISDDMKLAARELGLEYKDWLKTYKQVELIKCVACGTLNQDTVIVCPNCKVVLNREKFKELNLSFAN